MMIKLIITSILIIMKNKYYDWALLIKSQFFNS